MQKLLFGFFIVFENAHAHSFIFCVAGIYSSDLWKFILVPLVTLIRREGFSGHYCKFSRKISPGKKRKNGEWVFYSNLVLVKRSSLVNFLATSSLPFLFLWMLTYFRLPFFNAQLSIETESPIWNSSRKISSFFAISSQINHFFSHSAQKNITFLANKKNLSLFLL